MMLSRTYKKILLEGRVVGGYLVGKTSDRHYQCDGIYLEPEFQNGGLGFPAICTTGLYLRVERQG